MSWFKRSWVGPLFVLAAAYRLTLGFVNRWANDDHMEVVYRILSTGHLPKARECWECHHPKLFYLSTAALVKVLSLSPGGPSILAAQLLNVTVSIAALYLLARFVSGLAISHAVRNLVFATVAFNTCWWGISAHASTDSMVIAFSLAAFVGSYRFFTDPSGWRLLACAILCALAAGSKISGALVTLLCGFNIGLSLLSERKRVAAAVLWSRWSIAALLFIAPLPILGGYIDNHRITGDPFTLIMAKYERPPLFEETCAGHSGVQSVASAYFT